MDFLRDLISSVPLVIRVVVLAIGWRRLEYRRLGTGRWALGDEGRRRWMPYHSGLRPRYDLLLIDILRLEEMKSACPSSTPFGRNARTFPCFSSTAEAGAE